MFYGEYRHTVDGKGRVSIPAKFRTLLQGGENDTFYLTRGMDRCILICTRDKWVEFEKLFRNRPLTDPVAVALKRIFYSGANPTSFDEQGRIRLPQNLIDFAGIKKDVVIVGVSDGIEIWDAAHWDKHLQESLQIYNEMARKFSETSKE